MISLDQARAVIAAARAGVCRLTTECRQFILSLPKGSTRTEEESKQSAVSEAGRGARKLRTSCNPPPTAANARCADASLRILSPQGERAGRSRFAQFDLIPQRWRREAQMLVVQTGRPGTGMSAVRMEPLPLSVMNRVRMSGPP